MPDPIYLNHAGTSWPKPPAVVNAVRQAIETPPSEWPQLFETAHAAICRFFGVANQEQLLLTPGCTSSLTAAIANLELPANSRVLTSCWEHHALYAPLLKLQDRGIVVDAIAASAADPFDLNKFAEELKAGDVGLVAVTAACNVTGDLLPIETILEMARRYDAMVLIDAAQLAGWVDLDLDHLNADMVAFGGHKALQAPWGIGGLYVVDTARLKCIASTCELPTPGERELMASKANTYSQRPDYCDVGSVDQFSLAGLGAAVEWLSESSRHNRLDVARQQTERLRTTLETFASVRLHGSATTERRLPTIAFEVAGTTSSELAARLKQQGLIAGSGLQCSSISHQTLGTSDTGLVRLSVGVDQPATIIDAAIEILAGVLKNVETE